MDSTCSASARPLWAGVRQSGPERQRAPLPPPPPSGPTEASDWAARSRRKWTRQQAVHILQPGVECCHRLSPILAQAQDPAARSAPPALPAHPGGETAAVIPDLAALGDKGRGEGEEAQASSPPPPGLGVSSTNPCLGVEAEGPPSLSPLPLKPPGSLEGTSARRIGCGC